MNFQASLERIALIDKQRAFTRLEERDGKLLKAVLQTIGSELFTDRATFKRVLTDALKQFGLKKLSTPVKKAILTALSERDETAAVCTDAKGKPEPDPELRDHERVRLGEDWREYLVREVSPFVPDA